MRFCSPESYTGEVIAGFVAVIPLYVVGLLSSYLATRGVNTMIQGQSTGSFDHYFHLFLPPEDVIYSFIKVIIFVLLTTFIQCYYGYFASGGPEGVGVAAGHAIRLAIIVIVFANLIMTLVFWGMSSGVRISG